jgi:hypothetical protein
MVQMARATEDSTRIPVKIRIAPRYNPKTEKPYCCVPAVLQMIQERRSLQFASQDEIGYQLGLIVPKEKTHLFSKVRTGRMSKTGWGTQISKKRYSINNYFVKNNLPLKLIICSSQDVGNAVDFVVENLLNDNDIIICYNSQLLFGDGDTEHVSLIQEFDTENDELTIMDPAIRIPKIRKAKLSKLIQVLNRRETGRLGGFWIVSKIK